MATSEADIAAQLIERLLADPAFRAEFETFLEVVAGKRPSPCTVADGLEADWIAEACDRSQKEHRPVRIEEVRIS